MFMQALLEAIQGHPGLEVAGAATSGPEALEGIRALAPDVAVLDTRLPALAGRQVLEQAVSDGLPTRFLFLTSDMASGIVYSAMAAGAAGYLSKTVDGEAICDAITAVAAGEVVLSPEAQSTLAGAIREREAHDRTPLTPRERAVLALCADGLSTREIATRLGVASATVKTHLQSIYHKFDVPDRTSAVAAALRRGLLE
jgi:two-component system nitrate/nitrite response regulator NarL